jgi:hypothetical protein
LTFGDHPAIMRPLERIRGGFAQYRVAEQSVWIPEIRLGAEVYVAA